MSQYTKGGKKHMVVKRKRRRMDDDMSDDKEDDPYESINFESILGPIETPTDIVRRAPLRRILKSQLIDSLAGTAMGFIESEKNFNKILCRLSAILHNDDPRYLDLSFDRPPEMRDSFESKENDAAAVNGADAEAREVVNKVRELLLENINFSNEYLSRLQETRDRLCKAHMQKEALWRQLKTNAKEEDR